MSKRKFAGSGGKGTVVFAENRCFFVVAQGTDFLAVEFDLDDIEPEMPGHRSALPQVGEGASAERLLFPAVDRVETGNQCPGLPGPHFDKNKHAVLAGDNVDLVPAVGPVAGEDPESLFPLKPLGGVSLGLGPRSLLPGGRLPSGRADRSKPSEEPGEHRSGNPEIHSGKL